MAARRACAFAVWIALLLAAASTAVASSARLDDDSAVGHPRSRWRMQQQQQQQQQKRRQALPSAHRHTGGHDRQLHALRALQAASSGSKRRLPNWDGIIAQLLDYNHLTPHEAAVVARQCLSAFKLLERNYTGKQSEWAGQLLIDDKGKVIAGPLIPKSASTTLRQLFGDTNRPEGMRRRWDGKQTHGKTDKEYLQFTVVRNPIAHLIDIYKQRATNFPLEFSPPTTSNSLRRRLLAQDPDATVSADGSVVVPLKNLEHNAQLYCEAGDSVRRRHFKAFLTRMQVGKGTSYLNRTFLARDNEHHYGQLHYLQDFVTKRGQLVHVLQYVDALIRMERFEQDWETMLDQAFQDGHAQSVQWLNRMRKKGQTHRRHHVAIDDAHTSWRDVCQEGTAEGMLLEDLAHHYAYKYFASFASKICNFLFFDFVCLRYPFPIQCQMFRYVQEV